MECHHAFCPRFPMVLPKTPQGIWAFLPNGTGTFPHKNEQFCSSLWAKMLIMMG